MPREISEACCRVSWRVDALVLDKAYGFKRWNYVVLYVGVIYLTSYLVPFVTAALSQLGLAWVIRYCPVIAIVIAVGFAGYRLLRVPSRRSVPVLFFLGALGAGYGLFIHLLSDFPVERIHLLEYGVLSWLLLRVLETRYGPVRTTAYVISLVFIVGLMDELLQGLLPNRYYDARDVGINLCSGVLGLGLLYVGRRSMPSPRSQGVALSCPPAGAWSVDLACAASTLVALAGILLIEHYPVEESLLYGVWERPSRCGGMERFRFWPEGVFSWEDTEGNVVRGTYRLAGNHLEGLKIAFTVEEQHNRSRCGLSSSGRRTVSSYLTSSYDRFYFNQHEDRPWFRRGHE